jgi:hypothetical protein
MSFDPSVDDYQSNWWAVRAESQAAVPDVLGLVVRTDALADHGLPVVLPERLGSTACCAPNVHRDLRLAIDGNRVATAETFAIDFARVRNDRLVDGDGSRNEQFYGFGADVLAVADGTVVSISDGVAESTSYGFRTARDQGRLRWEPGDPRDRARRLRGLRTPAAGQPPGEGRRHRAGRNGPRQARQHRTVRRPALDFGLLDKPDLFAGRSLPFVFDRFTVVGTVDFETSEADHLVITPQSREVREAYPLHGSIQDFS